MTIQYDLTIGFNDQKEEIQLLPTTECMQIVEDAILRQGCDATIIPTKGLFTHERGDKVKENECRCELFFFDNNKDLQDATIRKIVDEIKLKLNQESVVVKRSIVDSDLW